jgi:hypothetical protein
MGDSPGRDSILAFAQSGSALASQTSVFGCSLHNPERKTGGRSL